MDRPRQQGFHTKTREEVADNVERLETNRVGRRHAQGLDEARGKVHAQLGGGGRLRGQVLDNRLEACAIAWRWRKGSTEKQWKKKTPPHPWWKCRAAAAPPCR